MKPNYRKTAQEIAREFRDAGLSVTLSRTPTTTNASTGVVTDGTPVTWPSYAIMLPASQGTIQAFDNRTEGDGSLVGKRLRFLKVAAYGAVFEPRKGDVITMNGGAWEALGCTPVSPDSTPLLFGVGVFER